MRTRTSSEEIMEFGMLHLFENPINKTEREVIKEQMELMLAAESLGFDSTWPAEHHFSEYGFFGLHHLGAHP